MSNVKRYATTAIRAFFTGLLAVLPLMVTAFVVVWIGSLFDRFLGPESLFGRLLIAIGVTVSQSQAVAYLLGIVFAVLVIFVLGLLLQGGLQKQFRALLDMSIRKLPLIGHIYTVADRFLAVLNQTDQTDLKSMSPVWVFFGGSGGTAVLGLLPTPELIEIDGSFYHVVLVPTAPIPVGGGLLYVPVAWVKSADFGVEGLTSIYVSMGVTSPQYVKSKTPIIVTDTMAAVQLPPLAN